MHFGARLGKLVGQAAIGYLAGAHHHIVDGKHGFPVLDTYMQAGIVDALVLDPTQHLHALGLQRGAMHPAGGLVQSPTRPTLGALQQPYLACGRFHRAVGESAGMVKAGINAPFMAPAFDIGGGRGRRLDQELGHVEADAPGTDDGHTPADIGMAAQNLAVSQYHRMINAGQVNLPRVHAGGDDYGIVVTQVRRRRGMAESLANAQRVEAVMEVAQGFVELLLARNPASHVELSANRSRPVRTA